MYGNVRKYTQKFTARSSRYSTPIIITWIIGTRPYSAPGRLSLAAMVGNNRFAKNCIVLLDVHRGPLMVPTLVIGRFSRHNLHYMYSKYIYMYPSIYVNRHTHTHAHTHIYNKALFVSIVCKYGPNTVIIHICIYNIYACCISVWKLPVSVCVCKQTWDHNGTWYIFLLHSVLVIIYTVFSTNDFTL